MEPSTNGKAVAREQSIHYLVKRIRQGQLPEELAVDAIDRMVRERGKSAIGKMETHRGKSSPEYNQVETRNALRKEQLQKLNWETHHE